MAPTSILQRFGLTIPHGRAGRRVRAWLQRYGLPELVGTAAAVVVLGIVERATGSVAAAAYAAAAAESVAYYGIIFFRDRWARERALRQGTRAGSPSLHLGRELLVEFGSAEVFDLLLIRPFCLAAGVEMLGGALGAIGGELVADVVFYLHVVAIHRGRRRLGGRFFACHDSADRTSPSHQQPTHRALVPRHPGPNRPVDQSHPLFDA